MSGLRSRVVIITGASAGIGAATAVALAGRGARLALGARRLERLEEVAARCRSAGGEALALACDVSRRADVDRLVGAAAQRFGRLDVMIANAGLSVLAPIHRAREVDFDEMVATNVKGTWYAMQAAAEVMLGQSPAGAGARRGHIIAVSSGLARRAIPLSGVYSMTKAAQLSLCEAMRVELGQEGVYVSSVHPFTTATEFFEVSSRKSGRDAGGLSRMHPPESVARAIVRLIERPRPECWPVRGGRWGLLLAVALPRLTDWAVLRITRRRTR